MCSLFPTEVSCSIPVVGAAGESQTLNGLCVLTQNIINEKIYLLLWFWFYLLTLLTGCHVLYRILVILLPFSRYGTWYACPRNLDIPALHRHSVWFM